MEKFVEMGHQLGLPMIVAKSGLKCCNAILLGGEFHGVAGIFRHGRSKGHALLNKTLVLLALLLMTH